VTYSTPGSFKVSLVATNSLGASPIVAIDSFITVSNQGLCNALSNFNSGFTPSVLPLSTFGAYTGYLTGHNSLKMQGFSEFFVNSQGYKYISGVKIGFGRLYTTREDATVTVVVWNARGPQHGPGSVIERKEVLYKQIQEDIKNNRPTSIVFDRETPVFSRPFQVGIEIAYGSGDTLAIRSSANGQGTNSTSWYKKSSGTWSTYAVGTGANIALNITAIVGVNPSVQVSASKLLVNPGEEVILNGRGASIFVWNADDGSVQNFAGPQLVVHPSQTTTYSIAGSGLTLCNNSATTTIYATGKITGMPGLRTEDRLSLYPNPGNSTLAINLYNSFKGDVEIQFRNALGQLTGSPFLVHKEETELIKTIETTHLPAGVYLVHVAYGSTIQTRKWIKIER
jgi:hypothetical protein